MSSEELRKAEKDFSATLDEQFPLIEKLPDYKNAVDRYLVLEKQIRQSLDLPLSKRIIAKIVDTLVDHGDWAYLDELVVVLAKKHGQLKAAIQVMVQHVISHFDRLSHDDPEQLQTKIHIIETIRTVTDKKIFAEVERAQVSRVLAEIYLAQDNLDLACEILCDLQVETYLMMPFPTKVEYILQQVDLTLRRHDYAQARVLLRKILIKTLKNYPEADKHKETYFGYLLQLDKHAQDYVEVVRHLLLLAEIPAVKELLAYTELLVLIVYYVVLAPHDNLQADLLHSVKANAAVAKHVPSKVFRLLELFTNTELIQGEALEKEYEPEFAQLPVFADDANRKNLQKRVVEHNLRIVNKYYLCIHMLRLLHLLHLDEAATEAYVSDMVNAGMITAKINRPQGIIKFDKHGALGESVNDLLNAWIYDVDSLLEEVDSIGHLINKEEMMHGIKQKS